MDEIISASLWRAISAAFENACTEAVLKSVGQRIFFAGNMDAPRAKSYTGAAARRHYSGLQSWMPGASSA
jgi:hypothetical protein